MRANTSISLKDRKTYTVAAFRGCDLSTVPSKVASSRASRMENFVIDDTLMHKRNGWVKKEKYTGAINGIWKFGLIDGSKIMLVHHGTTLTVKNLTVKNLTSGAETTALTTVAETTALTTVANVRTNAVFNNDKVLFMDGQHIWVVYGDGTANRIEREAYVPTTTISIKALPDTSRASHEEVNMLTNYRVNSLLGVADGNTHKYMLDGNIRVWDGDEGHLLNGDVVVDVSWLDISGDAHSDSFVFLSETPSEDSDLFIFRTEDESARDVFLEYDELENVTYLTIYGYKPLVDGRDNIKVTYNAQGDDKTDWVTKNTCMATFGIDGNNDRLFLAGNPDRPNVDIWSELDNFLYFPESNTCVCGTSQTRITGYTRLSDSVLAILKEESGQEASVYYRTGAWQTSDVDNNGVTEYTGVFRTQAGAIGKGLMSPYCVSEFAGDNLFMSNDGIYGLSVSGNLATTERYAKERSRSINKALASHDLTEAVGFTYNNRFYVSVGNNEVFVADARYKYKASDDIDGSFNYEWYHLMNVPARVFANIDGELWFGTSDGHICAFDGEYSDRLWEDVSVDNGDVTFAQGTGDFVYYDDSFTDLRDGERVEVLSDLHAINGLGVDVNLNGKTLYVTNLDETNGRFQLRWSRNDDDSLVDLTSLVGSLTLRMYYYDAPVVAKWYSGLTDLGTSMYRKTLLCMTVETEPIKNSSITMGYDTTRSNGTVEYSPDINTQGTDYIDTQNFSFINYSILPELNNSFTVRLNERNTNFVRFRFISDNDKDCGLVGFSLQYKINNKNRGVM